MRTQSSHVYNPSVKNIKREPVQATQLVPVLLRRGEREEIYYLPSCAVCGEPIRDFEEANVAVIGNEPSAPLESLGALGNGKAFRLPGIAVAVHFACDKHKWMPWVRATSVFCKDQRGPIEKLGWTGVCE